MNDQLELVPIERSGLPELSKGLGASVVDIVLKTQAYYGQIGFQKPWIGYCAVSQNQVVGTCAFKGAPKHGKVEIAYATLEEFQNQGIGGMMCDQLVKLAKQTDPKVIVTARTLRETGYSTRILEKNGFKKTADILDHDEAPVWEWTLKT